MSIDYSSGTEFIQLLVGHVVEMLFSLVRRLACITNSKKTIRTFLSFKGHNEAVPREPSPGPTDDWTPPRNWSQRIKRVKRVNT
jgi:hypothetical protein